MVGRSGKLAVATRALDGVERVITDWRAEGAPVPTGWTPDESGVIGSLVTINADRTPLKLWSVSGTGGRAGQALISQPGTNIWQASYSPNGRWISFEVARTAEPGRSGIAVSPATGGPPEAWTRIATDHTWPDKPRWAPDGRTLYFISRRPGSFFNLWGVRFDPDHGVPTATPFVITRFDSPSQMILPYMDRAEVGIAPRRLVLPMMTVNGSIWMLDDVDK